MNGENMIEQYKQNTLADLLGAPDSKGALKDTYALDLSSGPETYANICEKPAYDPK